MKFRPHFSVRTLAIFVTLVCAYFAAWEATDRFANTLFGATRESGEGIPVVSSPMPFVIYCLEFIEVDKKSKACKFWRRYYAWFYWAEFKLAEEQITRGEGVNEILTFRRTKLRKLPN